jgi:hypothetical protein
MTMWIFASTFIPLFIENPIKLQAVSNELDFKCGYEE